MPAPSASGAGEAIRTLPLLADDSLVARRLPTANDLADVDRVREVAEEIAQSAGVADVMPELWGALETADQEFATGSEYPYDYPGFRFLIDALTPEVVSAHPDELVELAGLLAVAAASVPTTFSDSGIEYGVEPAQVIAHAVAANGSCDATLTEAWLVSLGRGPRAEVYDELFERAAARCPDDPTPRWLWGHRMVEDSINGTEPIGLSRAQALSRPLRFFEEWMRDAPLSELPHAGLADALVTEAEAFDRAHVMPFTTRSYAQRAVGEFGTALALRDSPEFRVGLARAQSLLDDEATMATLDGVDLEQVLSFNEYAASVAEAQHQFARAAALAHAPVNAPDPQTLVYSPVVGTSPVGRRVAGHPGAAVRRHLWRRRRRRCRLARHHSRLSR
ncbi:MAG: hypothetical protein R2731_14480 [Nocardioides sp.]